MPCFKGLAVSIHTPDGPIEEHSIQKQARASRISSYIPVPPARVPPDSTTGKPEQSTFAISITLLTPGLNLPYSTPKPTEDDPYPRPRVVGGLPGSFLERGRYTATIPPYIPRTANPHETIAAYIYFDGRAKEEVATLLRRGEETWVNSRWVSVPDLEGGGLAEREFLFREVGLERWLNGLDLEGSKNKAERIERRQKRLERKRRLKREQVDSDDDDDEGDGSVKRMDRNGVLRYGGEGSPVEDVSIDDGLFSESDSDDEPPQPEAAGQIKVALFRVLASGEIKRGEYSPQFDAHDDDEAGEANGASNGDGGDGDIDHTTSFAKPKTLDPKTISTQTVTGLDPPDAPYAVFTFFYRGKKQLQKMGILTNPEPTKAPVVSKRKASGPDFSKLGPLKSTGTVGFSGYRDAANAKSKSTKNSNADAMDSDADDEDADPLPVEDEVEIKNEDGGLLSPEDARREGALAEGVQKIKVSSDCLRDGMSMLTSSQLKRQHSAEPLGDQASNRKSPYLQNAESPPSSTAADAGTPPEIKAPAQAEHTPEGMNSPFKRHRASMAGLANTIFSPLDGPSNGAVTQDSTAKVGEQDVESAPAVKRQAGDSDEEL